jgi:hypothetical protein
MTYYGPRQVQATGKWHYTSMNDGHVHAVGDCSPWESCPDCKEFGLWSEEQRACTTCNGRGLVERENPCPGHETEEEACEHYRQHLIDDSRYDFQMKPAHACAVCGEMTEMLAGVAYHSIQVWLCDKHRNRENLEITMPALGQIWSS